MLLQRDIIWIESKKTGKAKNIINCNQMTAGIGVVI